MNNGINSAPSSPLKTEIVAENDNNSIQTIDKTTDFSGYGAELSPELSELIDEFYELVESIGADPSEIAREIGVESAVGSILALMKGESGEIGELLLLLIGASVLLALAQRLGESFGKGRSVAMAGVGAVLALPIVSSVSGLVLSVREGLVCATELFSGLIPLFTAISAIGGGAATSVAQASGMSATLSVCSFVIRDGLLPAVMLMLALGLLSAFEPGGSGSPAVKGVKSA